MRSVKYWERAKSMRKKLYSWTKTECHKNPDIEDCKESSAFTACSPVAAVLRESSRTNDIEIEEDPPLYISLEYFDPQEVRSGISHLLEFVPPRHCHSRVSESPPKTKRKNSMFQT